jgi:PPK2 family polyphosphate:nucleotide phosphotransferase
MPSKLIKAVRVQPGSAPDLDQRDPGADLGLASGKSEGRALAAKATEQISALQERLWAEGQHSVLLVLQGMDASGKDGVTRHLLSGINPQGCEVTSFKSPTPVELAHDFLWRIHARTPRRGMIGVFNRSQYEDVVTTQVLGLIDADEAAERSKAVNAFEQRLVDQGTSVVKVFLHLSKEEQRERLQERIDTPEKNWKMELGDLETRKHWAQYQQLYEGAITATSTNDAPWHVVPADRKWVRDLVIGALLLDALERIDPQFPPPNPELQGLQVP